MLVCSRVVSRSIVVPDADPCPFCEYLAGTRRYTVLRRDAVMRRVREAAAAIEAVGRSEGIAVWQNNGVPAHQTVPHVHVHVCGTLPAGGTDWGPVPRLDLAETDAIAERLRPHLADA